MAILTREMILQADDLRRELVSIPEWGGEVYVRSLTGAERDQFEAGMMKIVVGGTPVVKLELARARLASLTMCDESGQRLFTEADVVALSGKCAAPLERVFEAAGQLSGLSKADVEELAKN